MDYILNHYNVFSFGDVTGSHIVGSVVCRGDLYNGVDEITGDKTNIPFGNSIVENSFPYVQGMIYGTPANAVTLVYLGTGNQISRTGYWNENDSSEGQFHVNGIDWNYNAHRIRTTDNYIDWDAAYRALDMQSKELASDSDNRTITAADVENGRLYLKAGERVTVSKEILDLITDAVYVDTTGGAGTGGLAGSRGTVINLTQTEDVFLPVLKYGQGENYELYTSGSPGEAGDGISIVWNIPYASYIRWGAHQGNEVGHVVALNASMYYEGGNYSGTMLVKELLGGAEGHMWPYTGDELIPTKKGFRAVKTIDGQEPTDSQKFNFHLYEFKDGGWGDRPIQTYSNNRSEIVFKEIMYTDEASHWYLMSEEQTPQRGYRLSKVLYIANVEITANYSMRSYESNVRWYKVKDGYSRDDLIVNGEIDLLKLETWEGDPTFNNETEPTVKIKKVDISDQSVLKGATLQILDSNGEVVAEWVSGTEVHEVIGLKREETYTLREKEAPEGYEIAPDTFFRFDADGKLDPDITTAAVSDDGVLLVQDTRIRKKIDIRLTKLWKGFTGEELDRISRIECSLYLVGMDGGSLKEVPIRTISIYPQYTQEGQVRTDWTGSFEQVPLLEDQKEESALTELRYEVRETCVIYKDGTAVSCGSDAWNQCYESGGDGDVTAIWTTTLNENTTDEFTDIHEYFQITNIAKRTGSVTVRKADGKKNGLNGVTFLLQKAEVDGDTWRVDDTWAAQYGTTDDFGTERGIVKFENLPEGNYLLTETRTLPGYTLLKKSVKLTIPYVIKQEDDTVSEGNNTGILIDGKRYYYDLIYTITNEQSFELPQAGETMRDNIWKMGTALAVMTAGMLAFRKKKACRIIRISSRDKISFR